MYYTRGYLLKPTRHEGHFDFRYLTTHISQIMWQWCTEQWTVETVGMIVRSKCNISKCSLYPNYKEFAKTCKWYLHWGPYLRKTYMRLSSYILDALLPIKPTTLGRPIIHGPYLKFSFKRAPPQVHILAAPSCGPSWVWILTKTFTVVSLHYVKLLGKICTLGQPENEKFQL